MAASLRFVLRALIHNSHTNLIADVLMVWHAFLLNPSDYINYCQTESLTQLPRVSFPWTRIVS